MSVSRRKTRRKPLRFVLLTARSPLSTCEQRLSLRIREISPSNAVSGKHLLTPVTGVGRHALSNYRFQSVVCTTLFYGYGFGLFSSQMGLSMLLARRFRYGPAEWIWRKLTYRTL